MINIAKYEILIPFAGLVLLGILGAMLVYAVVIGMAFAATTNITRQQCLTMFFSDDWECGYVESLANECWILLR